MASATPAAVAGEPPTPVGRTAYDLPEHRARVAAVADQVRSRPQGAKISVSKATRGMSHTPHDKAYKRNAHMVHVDELRHWMR